MSSSRSFDIVIFGATGFTGRLVAEYFALHAPASIKWALVGRDLKKLATVLEGVSALNPLAKNVPLLCADASNQGSIDRVVQDARVVLTTAGPFVNIGTPVVDACVRFSTDYCDITGETPWIAHLIAKYHSTALQNRVAILNMCGFDSVPSEMSAYLVGARLKEKYNQTTGPVTFYLKKMAGGFSGGTVATLMNMMDIAENPSTSSISMKGLGNPMLLVPKDVPMKKNAAPLSWVKKDEDTGYFMAPWIMASGNSQQTRRSAALAGFGQDFEYREVKVVSSYLNGVLISLSYVVMFCLLYFRPIRHFVHRTFLPKQGEGPSRKDMETGLIRSEVIGYSANNQNPMRRIKGVFEGDKDPGYLLTAQMISEVAFALALNRNREGPPEKDPVKNGIIPPVYALGQILIDRYNASGIRVKIVEDDVVVPSKSKL